ncbi:MAG TPA: PAS domain-containing sensor histidine kinase, partial [Flavisolibacter sp.]|nr:PAS domain-containing sensor histidine kinase [Flavisolibacter sp.]
DCAIFMIDVSGFIISWNKGAENIKGFSASEAIGKHISIFYTPEEIENDEPERNLRLARELGQFEDEGWRVRKDGSRFWASVVFTALRDSYGKLVGFGKVTRDITRRHRAEEEIKRLNAQLEDALHKSQSETSYYKYAIDESSIVAITDQKGIIRHVNENFCKISKYAAEELIGQDHKIINSEYHSKEFIRDLWVTIANGKIWRGEMKNKAKDGSFYWVDTTIVPFLDEKRKPYQYLAIRSDITQRKLAEEKILQINADLENKVTERTLELTEALKREQELSEMKSRFVSLASHEFRTPLSAILSSISLVDHYKSGDQEEKRKKHIDRIKASVRNLTDILDDFLSIDKLEQGKTEVICQDISLEPFLNDIVEEMEGMVKRKSQNIHLSFNGPVEIYQDIKILRNILLNLLSNAVKYSQEGKSIFIEVKEQGEDVIFSVRDEGIGIPEASQKELFGKFFRASNAYAIQGTGLGLNIVKKYVELLGGNISFVSKENKGSTFTVDIPMVYE